MEPSDAYYKAKKSFLFFVGCLFLAVFVGIKVSRDDQKITILPLSLEKPEWLTFIFAVLVLFYLFQFCLQWAAQKAEVQVNRFHRIDFIASVLIGAISLACFSVSILVNTLESFSVPSWTYAVIGGVIGALGSALAAYSAEKMSTVLGRLIKGAARKEEETLSNLLISGRWMLHYNPTSPLARKVITFQDDGSIGEGRNENEHKWRVQNELLEILNSQDQIFSRFTWIPASKRFEHTNDSDTLSIRSQTISKLEKSEAQSG